jgi:hypothetical protein
VTFQSVIDPDNTGSVNVFDPVVTTASSVGPLTVTSDPISLGDGPYSLVSTLDFTFNGAGSMTANTDLQVRPASVPEPTTLLLFGPGMLGLVALGRRRFRAQL